MHINNIKLGLYTIKKVNAQNQENINISINSTHFRSGEKKRKSVKNN